MVDGIMEERYCAAVNPKLFLKNAQNPHFLLFYALTFPPPQC